MVFGITYIAGEFHSVTYCITSHVRKEDFEEFLNLYKSLLRSCLDFSPDRLMMEASEATYNTVVKDFQGVTIDMIF